VGSCLCYPVSFLARQYPAERLDPMKPSRLPMKQIGRFTDAVARNPRLRARFSLMRRGDARAFLPRLDPTLSAAVNAWAGVLPFTPRVIVDVGANDGEYARQLSILYRPETYVLVEPVPELAEKLRTLRVAENTHVFACAAGAAVAHDDLYVYEHSAASSLLQARDATAVSYNVSLETKQVQRVAIRPLDDMLAEVGVRVVDLLKIDVQGYELEVLRGATHTLASTRWLFLEVSMFEHYEGQPLFDALLKWLSDRGYYLASTHNHVVDIHGNPLHCDAAFVNARFSEDVL
jgi:FkbM family methyltransferase